MQFIFLNYRNLDNFTFLLVCFQFIDALYPYNASVELYQLDFYLLTNFPIPNPCLFFWNTSHIQVLIFQIHWSIAFIKFIIVFAHLFLTFLAIFSLFSFLNSLFSLSNLLPLKFGLLVLFSTLQYAPMQISIHLVISVIVQQQGEFEFS